MFRLLAAIGLVAVCILFSRGDLRAAGATYSYDELGRLTGVLNDDNTGETYTYDDAGNRSATYRGNPSIFRIANVTVDEGTAATLSVTRLGAATEAASVRYFTLAGTAVPTINYAHVTEPGLLTSFAPTVSSQPVVISTQDDNVYNVPLTYVVRLDDMSTNSAIDTAAGDATVTIVNTDPAPVFAISASPAVNEGSAVTFTVTKTNPTALTHTISYATAPGSATDGPDFTGTSGTFSFAPNETSKTFNVATLTDVVYENAETLTATLSAPGNGAVLGTASAMATVTNTNTAPVFSVNTPGGVVEGQAITFTVTRTGGSGLAHNVNYATANGTAVTPSDYTAASGTLTFPASTGDATQTVTVSTHNDGAVVAQQNFTFNLSNATAGATISQGTGTGTIYEDDDPPGTPATITPTIQYPTSGYWTVSWTAPTVGVATYYELYRKKGVTGTESKIYTGPNLYRTFGPVSASLNGEWFYRVKACNSYGCSAFKGTSKALVCYQGYCD